MVDANDSVDANEHVVDEKQWMVDANEHVLDAIEC